METITVKSKEGGVAVINKVDADLLEGKRKPITEQEREDLANYKFFVSKGYEPEEEEASEEKAEKKASPKKASPKTPETKSE